MIIVLGLPIAQIKLKKVGKTTRPFRYDLSQIPYDYAVEVRNRFKGLDLIEGLMNYGRRFQRIARRDKKAFLSDQCKEIEENNRMGKTRDLFEKIRNTKGTFHAKMGSRTEIVWTSQKQILRRGGKNT